MTLEEYKRRLGVNAHNAKDLLETFFNDTLAPLAGQPDTDKIWEAWDMVQFAINYAYPKDK